MLRSLTFVALALYASASSAEPSTSSPRVAPRSGVNQCTCPNGNGAKGDACPTAGAEKCIGCKVGYDYNAASGKCDAGCPVVDNAVCTECEKGKCTYLKCADYYEDGDGNLDNGCEHFMCKAYAGNNIARIQQVVKGQSSLTNLDLDSCAASFGDAGCQIVSCVTGYSFSDAQKPVTITCDASAGKVAWSQEAGSYGVCQPVDCGAFGPFNYAYYSATGTGFGAVAGITCKNGFTLSPNLNGAVTCQANGKWSQETFECKPAVCGSMASFSNSDAALDVAYSADAKGYKDTATLTCKQGKKLSGPSLWTCGADGSYTSGTSTNWQDLECVDVCAAIPKSVYRLAAGLPNGAKVSDCSLSAAAKQCVITTCDSGYMTSGQMGTLACDDSGPIVKMVYTANSQALTCTAADVCASVRSDDLTDRGARVTLMAAFPDHTDTAATTCSGLTDANPTCSIVHKCVEGYTSDGAGTIECDNAQADSANRLKYKTTNTLSCSAVQCDAFTPANGQVTYSNSKNYPSTATVECDAGFLPGKVKLECAPDAGQYTYGANAAQTCTGVAIQDQSTTLTNGNIALTDSDNYPSTATYSCDGGYELEGSAKRTATTDGAWGGAEPKCSDRCKALSTDPAMIDGAPVGIDTSGCGVTNAATECPISGCAKGYSGSVAGSVQCIDGGAQNGYPTGTKFLKFSYASAAQSTCAQTDLCASLSEVDIRAQLGLELSGEADISKCELSKQNPNCIMSQCLENFDPTVQGATSKISCFEIDGKATVSIDTKFSCACLKSGPCLKPGYCEYLDLNTPCHDNNPATLGDKCGDSKYGVCKGVNACDSNPCQNNGQCVSTAVLVTDSPRTMRMFQCDCQSGFSGVLCEEEDTVAVNSVLDGTVAQDCTVALASAASTAALKEALRKDIQQAIPGNIPIGQIQMEVACKEKSTSLTFVSTTEFTYFAVSGSKAYRPTQSLRRSFGAAEGAANSAANSATSSLSTQAANPSSDLRSGVITGQADASSLKSEAVKVMVNCEYSAWTSWSDCTKSCGTGSRDQVRTITQWASNGGTACDESESSLKESEVCGSNSCTFCEDTYANGIPDSAVVDNAPPAGVDKSACDYKSGSSCRVSSCVADHFPNGGDGQIYCDVSSSSASKLRWIPGTSPLKCGAIQCTSPADKDFYKDLVETSLLTFSFDVTMDKSDCADANYQLSGGAVQATKCTKQGEAYTLSGCESKNTCTCDNGVPATGAACNAAGPKCASCDAGYKLQNGACADQKSTCAGASFMAGPGACDCKGNLLGKVEWDFSLEQWSVSAVPPPCYSPNFCDMYGCPGGHTNKGGSVKCGGRTCSENECCTPHDTCLAVGKEFKSSSCLAGTSLKSNPTGYCVAETCTSVDCCISNPTCQNYQASSCPSGTMKKNPAPGGPCNSAVCQTSECCKDNICTCDNGNPATGTDCLTDNSPKCAACNKQSGFVLNGAGTGCEKCATGYKINVTAGVCVKLVCDCDNGTPADGTDCPAEGTKKCKACNNATGIKLSADKKSCECSAADGYTTDTVGGCEFDLSDGVASAAPYWASAFAAVFMSLGIMFL